MTRVSLAAIRRSVTPGLRLSITRGAETVLAEVTEVDQNGFRWKRVDGIPVGPPWVSGWRPKHGDGKTYWSLASWVDIHSPTAWTDRGYGMRFEVTASLDRRIR